MSILLLKKLQKLYLEELHKKRFAKYKPFSDKEMESVEKDNIITTVNPKTGEKVYRLKNNA